MPRARRSHLHDRHTVAHDLDLLAGPDPVYDGGEFPGHLGCAQACHEVTVSDKSDPFCRPFGNGQNAIRDTFAGLASAAARTVTIKHV